MQTNFKEKKAFKLFRGFFYGSEPETCNQQDMKCRIVAQNDDNIYYRKCMFRNFDIVSWYYRCVRMKPLHETCACALPNCQAVQSIQY